MLSLGLMFHVCVLSFRRCTAGSRVRGLGSEFGDQACEFTV